MSNRSNRIFIAAVLVVGGAALLNFYAFHTPKSALGQARFHLQYRAADKTDFADSYHAQLQQHGGYTPAGIDEFLIGRLEYTEDEHERGAITRFYCLQAGGREGDRWQSLSDAARKKVAFAVLRDWKSYSKQGARGAWLWLEELRQNRVLFKGNLIVPTGVPNGFADSVEKIAPVAELFQRWNKRYAGVPFRKRPSPLKGTPFSFSEL